MPSLRTLAVAGLGILAACHFEDHTPEGSRRDEAQIREVIVEYYRGFSARDWAACRKFFAPEAMVSYLEPINTDSSRVIVAPVDSILLAWTRFAQDSLFPPPQAQILRADLHQVNGVASVWVTVRQTVPVLPEGREPPLHLEDQEHWVLQRTSDGWRVVFLTLPWTPR
ncbi:MAG: hypothetical protein ABI679_05660 [Gemmatimonadota bacterium]